MLQNAHTIASPLWTAPFLGLLLSIAALPTALPKLWHHHLGKIVAAWGGLAVLPLAIFLGVEPTLHALAHTVIHDYVPFGLLCWTLFALSSGIHLRIGFVGSPLSNAVFLGLGSVLASVMGTTGASMLLIRPFLAMNVGRLHQKHLIVFFIILVSNIGGVLSPIGDPPLFLGYLNGVDFFWTTQHALLPYAIVTLGALSIFLVIDSYFVRKESWAADAPSTRHTHQWSLSGGSHFLGLIGVVILAVSTGSWMKASPIVHLPLGIEIPVAAMLRDGGFIAMVLAIRLFDRWSQRRLSPPQTSDAKPSRGTHAQAAQDWAPLVEVLKIFAGLFLTLIPIFMLIRLGPDGPFHALFAALFSESGVPRDSVFFWLTGCLSAFLDNAPTYLVFFNVAGGEADLLMHLLPKTLLALSCGAVFMGALSYIGNAPNLMVKSMAHTAGVQAPSFLGYMAWTSAILLPLFGVLTLLFF